MKIIEKRWTEVIMPITERRTEARRNGKWVQIAFKTLKSGDTFRTFEPDGTQTININGKSEFVAVNNAFPVDGTYGIEIERN